jgi:hypothetical protein
VLRTARGALANVVEHADACTAVVTLIYLDDAVGVCAAAQSDRAAPTVAQGVVDQVCNDSLEQTGVGEDSGRSSPRSRRTRSALSSPRRASGRRGGVRRGLARG